MHHVCVGGMVRHFIVFVTVALTGCEAVPSAVDEADIVIAVYERDYGDVSESEARCVRETPVTYPLRGNPNCCHGDFWCLGCTKVTPTGPRVWLRHDLPRAAHVQTLRHEYTHVLLWCVSGDMAADHQVPEFGYSGMVDAPGSLAMSYPIDQDLH